MMFCEFIFCPRYRQLIPADQQAWVHHFRGGYHEVSPACPDCRRPLTNLAPREESGRERE